MPVVVALCIALALAACGDDERDQRSFAVTLQASLPEGTPLAGVRFWAQGRELGVSGNDGKLASSLSGREGTSAAVSVICPPGYRGPLEPRMLPLRAFVPASPTTEASALVLSLHCEPELRLAALAVRSRLADKALSVPVQVDGERIGATDAQGTGHFLLRVPPNASVRVTLDTASLPNALPQNPVRSFDIEESESILLFDQRFDIARRSTPASRARRERKPPVPYRIE